MSEPDDDTIDYAGFLQEALRYMVRRVMEEVAEEGMPGDHHFFISFRTDHPDVRVPAFLRDQYPEELRIILQNQYWDLAVDEEAFSVSLNFGGARHRLFVPFAAVTEFRDPAASLLLAFDSRYSEPPPEAPEPEPETPAPGRSGSVVRFEPRRRK